MLFNLFLQDDDHGFVVGTSIQGVQRPLESTGKTNRSGATHTIHKA